MTTRTSRKAPQIAELPFERGDEPSVTEGRTTHPEGTQPAPYAPSMCASFHSGDGSVSEYAERSPTARNAGTGSRTDEAGSFVETRSGAATSSM